MSAKKLAQNLSQEQALYATLIANLNGYKCVLSPNAIPTLTQSGLLAVLLERQRYKAIELAWRRTHPGHLRADVWSTLIWPFRALTARILAHNSARPLIGTVPRRT